MGFIKHRSQVAHLQIFVILKSSLRNNPTFPTKKIKIAIY